MAGPKRKIGRNEPCPCGSKKKYKKCCALQEQERTESPEIEAAGAAMKICMSEVAEKWTAHYSGVLESAAADPLTEGQPVPLPFLIDKFSKALTPWVKQNYPFMLPADGNAELFWIMLYGAVLESGTCDKNDVEYALQVIKINYS